MSLTAEEKAIKRQIQKEYREAHREEIRAYQKKWNEQHPEKRKEYIERYWKKRISERSGADND